MAEELRGNDSATTGPPPPPPPAAMAWPMHMGHVGNIPTCVILRQPQPQPGGSTTAVQSTPPCKNPDSRSSSGTGTSTATATDTGTGTGTCTGTGTNINNKRI
ncbi:hypothetical protein PUN28_013924 [Cardiocondyla obscurior]|uniref:Uncharacterized protein n=1 Tax=Cardiocondyla obscurior TaxID=286306 RepID=A0AAW2F5Z6_9HYME